MVSMNNNTPDTEDLNYSQEEYSVDSPKSRLKIDGLFRPAGPRVGGLAQPRKLNDATFTGYEDIIVKSPLIRLNIEDLDDILDGGIDYYGDDGNTVSNKPPGVDGFGMKVVSLGLISRSQELTCKATGKLYRRIWNGNTYTPWSASYTTENKPAPEDISGGLKVAGISKAVDDKYINKVPMTLQVLKIPKDILDTHPPDNDEITEYP